MGLARRTSSTDHAGDRRARPRDTAGLLDMLVTGDAEQRRRAAADLWEEPTALPGLLRAHAVETDPVVAEAILTALAGHDCAEVGRALGRDLRSEDAAVRNGSVQALQALPVAVETLVQEGLLTDPDPDVRVLAVMVLSVLPHPGVAGWLRPVVESDPEPNVVASVVDALTGLDDEVAGECARLAVARFPGNPYLQFLAGTR